MFASGRSAVTRGRGTNTGVCRHPELHRNRTKQGTVLHSSIQRLSSLTSPWATLCCGAHCCTSPSANASAHSLCLPLPSRMQPSRYSSPSSARDPVSTATQQIAAQLKAESPMQSGACSSCHNDPIQWTLTANHPSKS